MSFQSITEVLPVVYDKFTDENVFHIPMEKFPCIFEESAEIQLVIDSYHCGDLLERKPVVFDHGGGFSYSEIVQITGDCLFLPPI